MFELIFITSNNEKLAHARHLCSKYQIKISKQKNYGVGYEEPRIYDRESLLKSSIEDAIKRFSKNVSNPEEKFFFIEDTSVKIHALSSENNEIPGVDIKYWMNENNFNSINELLKSKGENRKVTVRSDVILVIPKRLQLHLKLPNPYVKFYSTSEGFFTEQEFEIETQPLYPWLNNRTFNKWFVPQGFDKPISLLEIDDADLNDFRKGAFDQMLDFLHSKGYIKFRQLLVDSEKKGKQLALFQPLLFIICGPTCSGKTTLAEYLMEKYQYYHIEASDFMYLNYYERHGVDSNVKIGDFAREVLLNNPGIVVNRILKHIKHIENIPIVITGFRDLKEIEIFENSYLGDLSISQLYINADIEIRFEREKLRNRLDAVTSLEAFKKKNSQQELMGLKEIENELINSTICNESSIKKYFQMFQKRYHKPLINFIKQKNGYYKALWSARSLENAILVALSLEKQKNTYYTTTEISHLINKLDHHKNNPKSKNNISRYFNQDYHPYFEIKLINNKTMYRLSNTGYSRAILLKT
ncbi:non-canonical purine NTP pyrophosphatase [Pontimicrobium aquaticum]|uniref:Uncharacterized protein n=1 Tax=Pontimicrobium aquaticum TaxID=2565367 RepID=A0A4U0ESR2_9FLAO|nr:non-canonical purine NTP pyrophosphatase [Pontimicrobium aquaticum]TJY34836.1 hypothetical protein E5167_11065 [Pontimicrobium aquaticum]